MAREETAGPNTVCASSQTLADDVRLISTLSHRDESDAGPSAFQILSLPDLTRRAVIAEPQFAYAGSPVVFSPDGTLVTSLLASYVSGVWRTADLSLPSRLPKAATDYGFLGNGMLEVLPMSGDWGSLWARSARDVVAPRSPGLKHEDQV